MPEMYFLIFLYYSHPIVMPERYPKDQCEEIGKPLTNHLCVKAPSFPLVTFIDPKKCSWNYSDGISCPATDTLTPLDKRYPGYTCGGHDNECRLLKVE